MVNMLIKHLFEKIMHYELEERQLLRYLKKYCSTDRVLDVGCGYGRITQFLTKYGVNSLGVDINPDIVAQTKSQGINAITLKEFEGANLGSWDVILMFHVIEHMDAEACFRFIDKYLDYLKPGGVLIIATPLLTSYFYEDFDHVKPYFPKGIEMVFSGDGSQVQYYSRNKIQLLDVWHKKYYHRITLRPVKYKIWHHLFNCFSALTFKVTFGLFGVRDGWMGVFRKAP